MADDIIPEIELTQWREGQTLTASDISVLHRALKEWDDEREQHIDNFIAGRRDALMQMGGEELVRAVDAADAERSGFLVQNAMQRFYQKRAEQLAARQKSSN